MVLLQLERDMSDNPQPGKCCWDKFEVDIQILGIT